MTGEIFVGSAVARKQMVFAFYVQWRGGGGGIRQRGLLANYCSCME